MWGGIFGQERTRLVIINGNLTTQHHIDDILCPTDLLFLQQQPSGVIYQHDNARPHSQNGTKYQYVALTCMLTRYDLNGTHMGCHRLWCLELLWDVTDLGVWNSYGMSQILVFGTPMGCHRSWCLELLRDVTDRGVRQHPNPPVNQQQLIHIQHDT